MIAEQLTEMQESIDLLHSKGVLDKKKVIVFGSNEPAERMIDYLESKNIPISAMVDNNEKKYTFVYKDIVVYNPESFLSNCKKEEVAVLIASKYYEEMLGQLRLLGLEEGKEVFSVVNMRIGKNFSLDEKVFAEEAELVRRGSEILSGIKEQYGKDIPIFILPFQAIGDVYMGLRYLKAYMEKSQADDYVITVVGKAKEKIAELCGYKNIVVLSEKESHELSRGAVFLGLRESNAKIIHHRLIHTNLAWKLGNYKNVTFDDQFKYVIYGLDKRVEVVEPPRLGSYEQITEIFARNDLTPEKTVVVAPYANTVANLPLNFWASLVKGLKSKGYAVVTNSSGESEPPIEGTVPILFPFDIMLTVIEYSGGFIGLRSGICDYVAPANGKKIILYPDRVYLHGSVIDFYGLKNMLLTDNVTEYVFHKDNFYEIIENILSEF